MFIGRLPMRDAVAHCTKNGETIDPALTFARRDRAQMMRVEHRGCRIGEVAALATDHTAVPCPVQALGELCQACIAFDLERKRPGPFSFRCGRRRNHCRTKAYGSRILEARRQSNIPAPGHPAVPEALPQPRLIVVVALHRVESQLEDTAIGEA